MTSRMRHSENRFCLRFGSASSSPGPGRVGRAVERTTGHRRTTYVTACRSVSYSRGSDVVVEALNAINTSQERERHANDARKGNIYGEFHFSVSGATSADVAQAKRVPIGFRLLPKRFWPQDQPGLSPGRSCGHYLPKLSYPRHLEFFCNKVIRTKSEHVLDTRV